MKKSNILIAVFAVMAAASVAKAEGVNMDFDGKKGAPMFSQLLAQAQELPAAEPAGIPSRVFTTTEQEAMDKAVASAIKSARSRGYVELAAGFDCLLKSGTTEQKSAFMNWNTSVPYRLPETCSFRAVQRPAEKGLLNWICRTVTEAIISTVCTTDENGKQTCMEQTVTAAREACNWE
ncbi:MAG TPA: hypothetical protein DCZ93_03290 [Elusimicrobia bacterium]|nr:hypothetical protein [Elusimicrobiota bacterium]